ncbi:uncharacterized protein G2W53_005977 [Senna tora]|uniref:Uncharacterized protein n=1 Tax=Senna tora TaxID=362788 RepID=A0A835CEC6_9FABA|nr:uncharacterized protein G2W53_005977 [Senna tora]
MEMDVEELDLPKVKSKSGGFMVESNRRVTIRRKAPINLTIMAPNKKTNELYYKQRLQSLRKYFHFQ